MKVAILTEQAFQKLLENKAAETMRIVTRAESMDDARIRLERLRSWEAIALASYEAAILHLDTEAEDWEQARAAEEALEMFEQQYVNARALYTNALNRLGFELRDARNSGVQI